MSDICKLARRHSRGFSKHRIKWPFSLNFGNVLLSCDAVGATGCSVDIVIARIRKGGSKFRDLVPFLVSRDLLLVAKGGFYSNQTYDQTSEEWWKNG